MPKIQLGDKRLCLYGQKEQHGCGVAAIRSILKTQYNLTVPREKVVAEICGFYQKRLKCTSPAAEKHFRINGTSPSSIAYCLRKLTGMKVKVFCSKKGNVQLLDNLIQGQLLPIIHAEVSYGGEKPEGHYLSFLGKTPEKVRLFDPTPEEGLKRMTPQKFKQLWYNPKVGEKWFLVSWTEGEKPGLLGKYI